METKQKLTREQVRERKRQLIQQLEAEREHMDHVFETLLAMVRTIEEVPE